MAGVVVLDANVLIALFDSADAHHEWALQFMLDHVDAEFSLSALTWAECLVHPARSGTLDRFIELVAPLQLDIEEFTELDAVQLAQIRSDHRLRMPDAVVLHTAMRRRATIATNDAALAQAAQSAGVRTVSASAH